MGTTVLLYDLEKLRNKWGWLLALGILMVVLGTVALIIMPAATIGTVMVLGWLLVVSGILEGIQAFRVRSWGWALLALDCWDSWRAGGPFGCDTSTTGSAWMDTVVCILFYGYRRLPDDRGDQIEISKLGMGCFPSGSAFALGLVASISVVVPRLSCGSVADTSRLVLHNVRFRRPPPATCRHSHPAGSMNELPVNVSAWASGMSCQGRRIV